MTRRRPYRTMTALAVTLLTGTIVWASPAWADPAPQDDVAAPSSSLAPKLGYYVVRPGDTLRGITARFLGDESRWQENWKLNPGVGDPDRISPGQRLRIILPAKLPEDGALLRRISRRVEEQPTPLAWSDAQIDELLRAYDGVRTFDDASAELLFFDDTLLYVTEGSLVFLGEEKRGRAIDRSQIEIVVGQADLETRAGAAAPAGAIEIVLGDARAMPKRAAGGALETRARRPEDGGAQLMVYTGESELEAAGARVSIPEGMGSAVAEGAAPGPPEKLLPAPADLAPAADTRWYTPRPPFRWAAVDGAVSYTVEVCRDPDCALLHQRVAGLGETEWRPEALPVEKLYWRVTATSPSGLDGYPAEPVPFEIVSATGDEEPPAVAMRFEGPQLAPRSGLHDRWIVGPGAAIEVEVTDATSGVDRWTPILDGEEVVTSALEAPWAPGDHELVVVAVDRAGNRFESEPLRFTYDPIPPALSWGVEGYGPADPALVTSGPVADDAGPAPAVRGLTEFGSGRRAWRVESDFSQVVLRPQRKKPVRLEGVEAPLDPEHGLWILAQDEHCPDFVRVSYDLARGARRGELVLRVEAVDCVGNARRVRWDLTPR